MPESTGYKYWKEREKEIVVHNNKAYWRRWAQAGRAGPGPDPSANSQWS